MNDFFKKYLENLAKFDKSPKSLKEKKKKKYIINFVIILSIILLGFVLEKTGKISYENSINNNIKQENIEVIEKENFTNETSNDTLHTE